MTHETDQRVIDYREHLSTNPRGAHLDIMRQRCKWLTARIEAKKSIGWDHIWDTAERDALRFAIATIEANQCRSRLKRIIRRLSA